MDGKALIDRPLHFRIITLLPLSKAGISRCDPGMGPWGAIHNAHGVYFPSKSAQAVASMICIDRACLSLRILYADSHHYFVGLRLKGQSARGSEEGDG